MATLRSSRVFCWHVLNRSALQRRTSCDFKRPASIPIGRVAVTLGNVQRHRLGCAQALIVRVAVSRQRVAIPVGPTDRLDGRTVYVELFMAGCYRAPSFSIPIPIPIPIAIAIAIPTPTATPTPIGLRPPIDRVVQVISEPFPTQRFASGGLLHFQPQLPAQGREIETLALRCPCFVALDLFQQQVDLLPASLGLDGCPGGLAVEGR